MQTKFLAIVMAICILVIGAFALNAGNDTRMLVSEQDGNYSIQSKDGFLLGGGDYYGLSPLPDELIVGWSSGKNYIVEQQARAIADEKFPIYDKDGKYNETQWYLNDAVVRQNRNQTSNEKIFSDYKLRQKLVNGEIYNEDAVFMASKWKFADGANSQQGETINVVPR